MATENYSNIRVSGATSPPPDYTDLISWNAGEKIYNWPALDQIPVALIYDDWTDGISGCYPSVDLAGWTLDATHPCVWRAAPGSEIDPVTKSGAKITRNPSDTFGIVARANHWMRIEGLGVHLPGLTTRALTYIQHQKIVFDRCAIYDCALLYETGLIAGRQDINNSTVEVAGMTSSGGAALQLYALNNATVIQLAGKGGWNGQVALHSCTINNVAVYNGNTKTTLDTCYSCTGNYNAQNNNGSASPPGANSINTLVTADFADFAGGDYHLAVASALIGLGENKYSAYQYDIDGDEWPSSGAWDIGADYYTSGGADTSLDGDAAATTTAAGALTTQILFSSAALSATTATGSLNTSIPLSGAAAAVGSVSGNLTAQITLSGDAIAQAVAAAGLSTQILLGGGAQSQTSATGELAGGAAALSGVAQGQATAIGDLTIQIRLQGAALAQSSATADITATTSGLAGNAQASASSSAALTTAIPVLGVAASVASAGGALITAIPLTGAAASVSGAIGSLDLALTLSAAALAQAAAGGTLTTQITLAGSAVSRAAASGALASGAYTPPPAWRLARVRPETRMLAA